MNTQETYYSFSDVQTQILNRFDGDSADTVLVENVKSSIRRNFDDIRFRAQDDFRNYIVKGFRLNTASDRREYALPPQLVDIIDIRYFDADDTAGEYTTLRKLPFRELLSRYSDADTGSGEFFSIYGNDLVLAPTPDSASDYILIDYVISGDELVSDDDIVAIPSKYLSSLLRLVEAEVKVYEGDAEVGMLMEDRTEKKLERVLGISTQRANCGDNIMQPEFNRIGGFRKR